jgi:ABC-type antimicrobial peptide transport system permease subunit
MVLVGIALLVALPAAGYLMHSWLQHYQYHAGMSWWIFAAAGFGALAITIITVSYQAIKAALLNPVKSLRAE